MLRLERRMRKFQSFGRPILMFVLILICLLTFKRITSQNTSGRIIPLNQLAKDSLRRNGYEIRQHWKEDLANLKETVNQRLDNSKIENPVVQVVHLKEMVEQRFDDSNLKDTHPMSQVVANPIAAPKTDTIVPGRDYVGSSEVIKSSADKGNVSANVSKTGDEIPKEFNSNIARTHLKQLYANDVFDPSLHKCFRLTWNNVTLAKLIANRKCRIVTLPNDAEFGRMGNNLFRLAALIGIAERHDLLPIISPENLLMEYFDLPNLYNIDMTNFSAFQAPDCCRYYSAIENLDTHTDWVIYGYMQSWRYFKNARHILKQALRVKEIHIQAVDQFLKGGTLSNVCIHVRRGDMDHILSEIQGYSVAGVKFIKHAVDYFKQKLDSANFIVVSDDMQWCRRNLNSNQFIFSPFTDPGSDMALLMRCDHVIVTSGSFGWWGAWLSGNESVHFKEFPIRFSKVGRQTNFTDYYPSEWIGMS